MNNRSIVAFTLLAMCHSTAVLANAQISDTVAPEKASSRSHKNAVEAKEFILATANPLATQAGYDILKAGGTAIDAMVAVQTVLGLVEPQSSGLGGGAFAIYYDANTKHITSFDGRETAPLKARPELFQNNNGESLKFYDAVVGGRSVGTPGTVKLLGTLHKKYGNKKWKNLLVPATKLAFNGFKISPRLASSIAKDTVRLSSQPDTLKYFFDPQGAPLPSGHLLKNPAYGKTLKQLASKGANDFYRGSIAKDIVKKVQTNKSNPGLLSLQDFSNYDVIERAATCAPYLTYSVCGMGPPSSGALTVGQILGITSHFDLANLGSASAKAWQIIGDASRLAFADRGRYMADSDFVPMPQGLLDPTYLAQRASLITMGRALSAEEVMAGSPDWRNQKKIAYSDDQSIELPSTSHFVIVDKYGNVLSMTTTVENGFGSRLMSNGFILNNELTDFSFASYKNGYPIANRLEPGKRPRSSMSPTIIMKKGKPYLAIGSPGGSRIIGYVANTIISILTWGTKLQDAINAPHLVNRFGTYDLEKGTNAELFKDTLLSFGYKVNIRDLNSGIQAILIEEGKLTAAADPRREGTAKGD